MGNLLADAGTSDDDLQSLLFDLLGAEHFGSIADLIANRNAIASALKSTRPSKRSKLIAAKKAAAADKAARQSLLTPGVDRLALPPGTTRTGYLEYEEVLIPPPNNETPAQEPPRVPITEFPDWARPAFAPGVTHLNRIQSIVFQTAFHTNENMLVCAPTGAGKTNVALMTILHQAGLDRDAKIVYVAPMKALAAEQTANFARRLAPLGMTAKELTGDMQLTKKELAETSMIVTTPEKWDVITRKSSTDAALTTSVKLLILDEVHLLHDDRGPVIETLVARTLRQVETTQSMIRIVGLSATLPNYQDVGSFLRVNPDRGLFHFDGSFRPVPLHQTFIGLRNPSFGGFFERKRRLSEVCYQKAYEAVRAGHQVLIFVHARKQTVATAREIMEAAAQHGHESFFLPPNVGAASAHARAFSKSRNADLRDVAPHGFGTHHAGMLRSDRNLVEAAFSDGALRVLVCTATLAWGVNLPAHTVIIKGTEIYDPSKGGTIQLSMLDVMQIFGRAGRPQFDSSGEAILITNIDAMHSYLRLLNHAAPIESQFLNLLSDNLNAEIVAGTVSTLPEAVRWLSYTYLYVRALRNPLAYGISIAEKAADPLLASKRNDWLKTAAKTLDGAKLQRVDPRSGILAPTDLGRVASHFYISYETMDNFNKALNPTMKDVELLAMLSSAQEFEQLTVREDELPELDWLVHNACAIPVRGGGVENSSGKVNTLLQAYISQTPLKSFSLICDSNYVAQNAARLMRAVFEIVLNRGWASVADIVLGYTLMLERRAWRDISHPLRQVAGFSQELALKLEESELDLDRLREMPDKEIGAALRAHRLGSVVAQAVATIPHLEVSANIAPITRSVLRVTLSLTPAFTWSDRHHGSVEPFWIWVEDGNNEHTYHSEYWLLHKAPAKSGLPQTVAFTIPIFEPLPPQYYIRIVSDRWLGAENTIPLSFRHLILPAAYPPHTELLDLQPLPVTALKNSAFENALYGSKFTHFNPVQTQFFHTIYHTDENVLVGAPTGSGKTVAAELTVLRVLNEYPGGKVVYIGPLKALVRERMADWRKRMVLPLGIKMVELTGDHNPDIEALKSADIICTVPEKWDGVSRGWGARSYVRNVRAVILDEIHLLGSDRGPILEVIVSRMRWIGAQQDTVMRIVGLSTALANARDLADWLGVTPIGLYNFRPAVRPVPLQVHIAGFAGRHYCPRMASMNKPTYAAIRTHAPSAPVLVFVSSRRQTRLTAQDLIALAMVDEAPRQWVHMPEDQYDALTGPQSPIQDPSLKSTLAFGIGLHHAGLSAADKSTVESLFADGSIQVLVSTSTLAWGVNLPAHLVVVKGTEYFDPKTCRYVDYPITDVLQMMGRAGRPQFDTTGTAVILVEEGKKAFYRKFLYEPFPVESSLLESSGGLPEHFNAEIVAGTISSHQEALDWLTWTYCFRRLLMNPSYYGVGEEGLGPFLSQVVADSVAVLRAAGTVRPGDTSADSDEPELVPTVLGRISSFYYIKADTVASYAAAVPLVTDAQSALDTLVLATEWMEVPVRHNEDKLNEGLAKSVRWPVTKVDGGAWDSPKLKTHLLIQAHMGRVKLPMADYGTDTSTVLGAAMRMMQALVDVAAVDSSRASIAAVLALARLVPATIQGLFNDDSTLRQIPGVSSDLIVEKLKRKGVETLSQALASGPKAWRTLASSLKLSRVNDACSAISNTFPRLTVTAAQEGGRVLVGLRRLNGPAPEYLSTTARYAKPKAEGWWVMVGDVSMDRIIALRRTTFKRATSVSLDLGGAEITAGQLIVHVVSDAYLGLDHEILVQ